MLSLPYFPTEPFNATVSHKVLYSSFAGGIIRFRLNSEGSIALRVTVPVRVVNGVSSHY